jgi:ribosomal protein L17
MTRNLTLAVDSEVLERYRAEATRLKTSVNALIRKHMAETVGTKTKEQEAAIERMIARSKNGPRATYAPPFDRSSLWDRSSER